RAHANGHQVVADRLAVGVLPVGLDPHHGEFLGVPVDATLEAAIERFLDVLGGPAGRVFDVPHHHGRVLLAIDQVDVDSPVGVVHVRLFAVPRQVLPGGADA